MMREGKDGQGEPTHVRHLRIHRRLARRPAHPEGHVRHHGASRPRRRGAVPRRRRGAGAPEAVAHRPRRRQPAHGARRRRPRRPHHLAGARARRHPARGSGGRGGHRTVCHRVQRRDLQLPRPARRAGGARLGVQDALRHRSAAHGLPRLGRRRPFAAARHVRVRHLEPRDARIVLRAGFLRHQTALLHGAEGERRQRGCNGGRELRGGQRNGMRGRG